MTEIESCVINKTEVWRARSCANAWYSQVCTNLRRQGSLDQICSLFCRGYARGGLNDKEDNNTILLVSSIAWLDKKKASPYAH